MEKSKILLVDDEPDILEFMSLVLTKENFEVFTASNGLEAIKLAKINKPHLIILDVMMPEMDGIETCEELRKMDSMKDTLIVFLSARGEEFTQLAAYKAGGTDYIQKPIKPKILVSKIQALLNMRKEEIKEEIIQVGEIQIFPHQHIILVQNQEFVIPKKEFQLFLLLARNANKVVPREKILSEIWGNDVVVGGRTIDVHIRKLREKFGDTIISTIKGVGYKLNT